MGVIVLRHGRMFRTLKSDSRGPGHGSGTSSMLVNGKGWGSGGWGRRLGERKGTGPRGLCYVY